MIPITWHPYLADLTGLLAVGSRLIAPPDIPAGAAWWLVDTVGRIAALRITCPCGCGTITALETRVWAWDLDKEHPSLDGTILMRTPCGWRGTLRKGVFNAV